MAKCAVCGSPHAVCGPRTTVVPVDSAMAERKGDAMSGLKRYEVELPGRGGPRRTVLMLTDADAKRQGLEGKELKPAGKSAPNNKSAKAGGSK